jgi:Rrf2 family protein
VSKVFALSEAASIAIHSMVLIARSDKSLNVIRIAETTGFSKNHIAKVLQRLVKNDLLKSVRGPAGGFTLRKAPVEVTLLEVYESIEGQMEIKDCPLTYEICNFEQCVMGNVVNKMTLEFKKFLQQQTLKNYLQ